MLRYAAGALANLSVQADARETVVQQGALAPLVMLASKSTDARVLAYAVGALASLADNDQNRPKLLQEFAARPLVKVRGSLTAL